MFVLCQQAVIPTDHTNKSNKQLQPSSTIPDEINVSFQ